MHQSIKFIVFWNDILHVSDGLSVHHQEFKTVRTATGICQTDTAVCLLASRQLYLFDICLLHYVQSLIPDVGRKTRPKHVECLSKIMWNTTVDVWSTTVDMWSTTVDMWSTTVDMWSTAVDM